MAARRRGRHRVDKRIDTMSAEAVYCRSWGHHPVIVPTTATERAEYRKIGQRVINFRCGHGCSYWRRLIVDDYNGELVSAKSGYHDPASYLVREKGSGRLPRSAARVAFLAHATEV